MRFGLIIALLLSGLHATVGTLPVARLTVAPAQPLIDDRLEIKVSGLPPNQSITLRATSVAQDRLEWRSVAVFTSRPDGTVDTPARQSPLFLRDLAYFGDTARVEIPVEQVRGPLLLLSGQDDQIWPSTMMAERIMERLRRNRHPYGDDLLSYEEAGHWLPTAYVPMRGLRKGMKVAIGGTPEGTARAQADSWPKILRFLTLTLATDKGDNPAPPRK